jgi:hypothetical protein
LATGINPDEIKKIEKVKETKKVGRVIKGPRPNRIAKGKFRGWPGDAKERSRIKYRKKLHVRKMEKIKNRKANRVRFKIKMLARFLKVGKK